MAVAILKNTREDEVQMFMLGFCSDGNLGTRPFPGDNNFLEVTYPAVSPGANQPCVLFQELVADNNCFISINGLTAGDTLILPVAGGGTVAVPMIVGGVAHLFPINDPVFTTAVGVAVDVTLCNGNGYFTRGVNNTQIAFPGSVILYHELVGHALHHCRGDFNSGNPEVGQAIPEENVLRAVLGLPQRTLHDGGCGGGTDDGCFVATAAYGSAIASEVQELRMFRDFVLRSTRWGSDFFDDFYKYYYTISPPIAARMQADEHLAEMVRAILVQPLLIALRLFLALPDDPSDSSAASQFCRSAIAEYCEWVRTLPLSQYAPVGDPVALAHELSAMLDLSGNVDLRHAFFESLHQGGVTPIQLSDNLAAAVKAELMSKGVSEDDAVKLVQGEAHG